MTRGEKKKAIQEFINDSSYLILETTKLFNIEEKDFNKYRIKTEIKQGIPVITIFNSNDNTTYTAIWDYNKTIAKVETTDYTISREYKFEDLLFLFVEKGDNERLASEKLTIPNGEHTITIEREKVLKKKNYRIRNLPISYDICRVILSSKDEDLLTKYYLTDYKETFAINPVPNHKAISVNKGELNSHISTIYGINNYIIHGVKEIQNENGYVRSLLVENTDFKDCDELKASHYGYNSYYHKNWNNNGVQSGIVIEGIVDDKWRYLEVRKDNDNIKIELIDTGYYADYEEPRKTITIPNCSCGTISPVELQLIIDTLRDKYCTRDGKNQNFDEINCHFIELAIIALLEMKKKVEDCNNSKYMEVEPLDPVNLSKRSFDSVAKKIVAEKDDYLKYLLDQYEAEADIFGLKNQKTKVKSTDSQ